MIEIDGFSHDETNYDYDIDRQQKIERLGISFLRFNDSEVKKNMEGVIQTIEEWIEDFENKCSESA